MTETGQLLENDSEEDMHNTNVHTPEKTKLSLDMVNPGGTSERRTGHSSGRSGRSGTTGSTRTRPIIPILNFRASSLKINPEPICNPTMSLSP